MPSLRRCFGSLQEELKKQGILFYKKLSAATYQSESDVVEQFELALRLLANPRDKLHLDILAKAWGGTKTRRGCAYAQRYT